MDKIIKIDKNRTDITNLYTVYDILAEKYGPVFESVNDAVATRQFRNMLKDMPDISKEDFQLVKLGYFDRQESKIVPDDEIKILMTKEGNEYGKY